MSQLLSSEEETQSLQSLVNLIGPAGTTIHTLAANRRSSLNSLINAAGGLPAAKVLLQQALQKTRGKHHLTLGQLNAITSEVVGSTGAEKRSRRGVGAGKKGKAKNNRRSGGEQPSGNDGGNDEHQSPASGSDEWGLGVASGSGGRGGSEGTVGGYNGEGSGGGSGDGMDVDGPPNDEVSQKEVLPDDQHRGPRNRAGSVAMDTSGGEDQAEAEHPPHPEPALHHAPAPPGALNPPVAEDQPPAPAAIDPPAVEEQAPDAPPVDEEPPDGRLWPEIEDLSEPFKETTTSAGKRKRTSKPKGPPAKRMTTRGAVHAPVEYEAGDPSHPKYWESEGLGPGYPKGLRRLVNDPDQLLWRDRPYFNLNGGARYQLPTSDMTQYHLTPYRNNSGRRPYYITRDRSRHITIVLGKVAYFVYLSAKGAKESRKRLIEALRQVVMDQGELNNDGRMDRLAEKLRTEDPTVIDDLAAGKVIRYQATDAQDLPIEKIFSSQKVEQTERLPTQLKQYVTHKYFFENCPTEPTKEEAAEFLAGGEEPPQEILNSLGVVGKVKPWEEPGLKDICSLLDTTPTERWFDQQSTVESMVLTTRKDHAKGIDEHIAYHIASTGGTFTNKHADTGGAITFNKNLAGHKLWFFEVGGLWDLVILRPGEILIMPPGIVHQVFTPDPCLAIGGHAYSCHPVLLERAYKARLKEVTASSVTNQLGPHTGDLLLSMTWFYIKKGWEREDDIKKVKEVCVRLDELIAGNLMGAAEDAVEKAKASEVVRETEGMRLVVRAALKAFRLGLNNARR